MGKVWAMPLSNLRTLSQLFQRLLLWIKHISKVGNYTFYRPKRNHLPLSNLSSILISKENLRMKMKEKERIKVRTRGDPERRSHSFSNKKREYWRRILMMNKTGTIYLWIRTQLQVQWLISSIYLREAYLIENRRIWLWEWLRVKQL